MGFHEQVAVKDLRRLGGDQAAAVQRMEPAVVAADLDRILERDAVNGSSGRFHHGRALVIPVRAGKGRAPSWTMTTSTSRLTAMRPL